MAADKTKFTYEEQQFITNQEISNISFAKCVRALSQFKLDDILVGFHDEAKKVPITNSYGVKKKFKVVHVDQSSVPYMKELNKVGKPTGNLIYPIQQRRDSYNGSSPYTLQYHFEVDPDMADAIILDDMANYNPTNILKAKSDGFKDISLHNASLKVNTHENTDIIAYAMTIKAGSQIWRSARNCWTVISTKPMLVSSSGKPDWNFKFLEVQTHKGEILNLSLQDFKYKAIYSGQPRSFKELRDPK